MSIFLFSDLDDTLFQTASKMQAKVQGRGQAAFMAAQAGNGRHSYMDPRQSEQFDWLNKTTRLIPVTARSTESFERVSLDFKHEKILANGAVILDANNMPDKDWLERTATISNQNISILSELSKHVEAVNRGQFRHWIVKEYGLPIYLIVKSNGPAGDLDAITAELDALKTDEVSRLRNGNNLIYCPSEISKKAAVSYLIEREAGKDDVIWGMGDSVTDLSFMSLCQMQVIPSGSQIDQTRLKGV